MAPISATNSNPDTVLLNAEQRASRYTSDVRERRVSPSADALHKLDRFREPLPEKPSDPDMVVALLDRLGSPATVASTAGRYFGFVTGGVLPAALAASWLAAAWDQNGAFTAMSPTSAALEEIVLEWPREIFGLPASSGAGFITGATMANFTCLAAAPSVLLRRAGWNVEHLRNAMEISVDYLQVGNTREPAHYTPEFSRRARAIEIWAALKSLGRSGLANMIERSCKLATRFGDGLARGGKEILNNVVLNQVLVSFGDAELNKQIIAARTTGRAGAAEQHGKTKLRCALASAVGRRRRKTSIEAWRQCSESQISHSQSRLPPASSVGCDLEPVST